MTRWKIFSTNLRETDIAHNDAQKFAKGAHEVYERTHLDAVLVLTTCVAGIISDDVKSVCGETKEELGAPVIAIFCKGFHSRVQMTGSNASCHAIARKLIQPARECRGDTINVINFWDSDMLGDWLGALGVKPNYITPYSTIENLRRSSEAAASVQICPTLGSYLGATLGRKFGVSEINAAPSYGIAQADHWFRVLGKLLHREDGVGRLIAAKRAERLSKIETLREKLHGEIAYVTADTARDHTPLSPFGELGMKARGVAILHHDPVYDDENEESSLLVSRVKEYGDVPDFNICNKQEFELVNMPNRLQSGVLLVHRGGMTLWGTRLGIPSPLIGDEYFNMGYGGIVRYGEWILETTENDELVKSLKRHAINPYTKWWLGQKPYTFLKEGTAR